MNELLFSEYGLRNPSKIIAPGFSGGFIVDGTNIPVLCSYLRSAIMGPIFASAFLRVFPCVPAYSNKIDLFI